MSFHEDFLLFQFNAVFISILQVLQDMFSICIVNNSHFRVWGNEKAYTSRAQRAELLGLVFSPFSGLGAQKFFSL